MVLFLAPSQGFQVKHKLKEVIADAKVSKQCIEHQSSMQEDNKVHLVKRIRMRKDRQWRGRVDNDMEDNEVEW